MFRNSPDAIAIFAMLLLLPGFYLLRELRQGVHFAVTPIRSEIRSGRDHIRMEGNRFREESIRIRQELLRCFRLRLR